MKENLICIHTDKKRGVQYLLEKNTSTIYIHYPKTTPATKKMEKFYNITTIAIVAAIFFSFVILNTESVRSLLYVGIIKREMRLIIIIATIFMQILLLLIFYKGNYAKHFVGYKEEIEMSLEGKKRLLLKSLTINFCLTSLVLGVSIAVLAPLAIAFIEYANGVLYIQFLLGSSICIGSLFAMIKATSIPIFKFYIRLNVVK